MINDWFSKYKQSLILFLCLHYIGTFIRQEFDKNVIKCNEKINKLPKNPIFKL